MFVEPRKAGVVYYVTTCPVFAFVFIASVFGVVYYVTTCLPSPPVLHSNASFFLPQERHFDQFRNNKDKTLCPTQKRILRNYVNEVETRDNACIPTQSKHDMTSVWGLSSAKSNLLVVQ